jgi:dihydroneopterin triphosphate diphosphatase
MDAHYLTQEPIEPIEEFVFAFEVESDTNVQIDNNISVEHDKFKWVTFEEAISLLKWGNNRDAFRKLNKILMN